MAPVVAVIVVPLFVPPANVPLAPLEGDVNVTTTPLSKFPLPSFTVAARFVAKAAPITALCGVPAVAVTEAGAPARLVRLKLAGPTPGAVAVTVKGPPAVPLAVKVGAVATPLVFVVAVTTVPLFVPPEKVPLAPLEGAVNVTTTPSRGREFLSSTVACKDPKAVLMATLCEDPEVAAIDAGVPDVFVKLKLAGPTAPAVAATV